MVSSVPHVFMVIVPRQIQLYGDACRRGCDQSEGLGSDMKFGIHRRVLSRTLLHATSEHTRKKANKAGEKKTWKQTLRNSRMMQTFRDRTVRERLMRSSESKPYLGRKDFRQKSSGFVKAETLEVKQQKYGPKPSIAAAVNAKLEAQCAECSLE